jgi:hypothetical protein
VRLHPDLVLNLLNDLDHTRNIRDENAEQAKALGQMATLRAGRFTATEACRDFRPGAPGTALGPAIPLHPPTILDLLDRQMRILAQMRDILSGGAK